MVLFAISLYAVLTTANNVSTVECSDDQDCLDYHDKLYCYAGKCTDSCPPGYKQETVAGDEPFFTCTCDTSKGFNTSGHFPRNNAGVRIPKCACVQTYCHITVYAKGIGYTDGIVPREAPPNCKIKSDEIPPIISSFILYMIIGTMILFTFLNLRTASGVIYDFHRYIGLYVLASIAVIVFVQTVQPFTAGFTRTMGFGVIIHNSAEWNFLLRLHFGKKADVRNATSMCVMLYYVILLIAMLLPLKFLFLVAMIQGGFLDWTLFFFTFVGIKNSTSEPNWQYICKNFCGSSVSRFAVWYGFASFFHLVTVEILFVGFALNSPVLIGIGSIFLVPTFLSYTFWAYGEDRSSVLCGPELVMDYKKPTDNSTDFSLAPYTHTTRKADVLWQAFVGDRAVTYVTEDETVPAGGDESETAKLIKRDTNTITIDDCESFKFGVTAQTINKNSKYISWIPVYWAAAFIIVVCNATAILNLPDYNMEMWLFLRKRGCPTGFELGAW